MQHHIDHGKSGTMDLKLTSVKQYFEHTTKQLQCIKAEKVLRKHEMEHDY